MSCEFSHEVFGLEVHRRSSAVARSEWRAHKILDVGRVREECVRGKPHRKCTIIVATTIMIEPKQTGAGFEQLHVHELVDEVGIVGQRQQVESEERSQVRGDRAQTPLVRNELPNGQPLGAQSLPDAQHLPLVNEDVRSVVGVVRLLERLAHALQLHRLRAGPGERDQAVEHDARRWARSACPP